MRRYHHPVLPTPPERVILPKDSSHHILQVCRHPRGTELNLFDGAGAELRCELVDVQGQRAVLQAVEALAPTPAPPFPTTLLLALCKPAAWETGLRMATELGVDTIQPVLAARSSVRKLRLERWERVLVSAAEQCGRRWLPRLHEPLGLPQALEQAWLPPRRLVLAPGSPPPPSAPPAAVALLVGPEGGLSEEELALAIQAGFEPTGLTEHVLRVDTAVAAALARCGVSCS
jgi:16S rRNA (uracil1498-N3)-methyltransferase